MMPKFWTKQFPWKKLSDMSFQLYRRKIITDISNCDKVNYSNLRSYSDNYSDLISTNDYTVKCLKGNDKMANIGNWQRKLTIHQSSCNFKMLTTNKFLQ